MRFVLSRAGLVACSVILAFCCSCEEHHPGELPDVQRDRLAESQRPVAREHRGTAASPAATTTPTPANFFPEQSPQK